MTSMPPGSPKNPSELLEMQVQVLNAIYQAQLKQQELLDKIRAQQERLLTSIVSSGSQGGQGRLTSVSIVNFNMPFLSLVGILVKVALASIPAALILGVIWAIIVGGIFLVLSILGIGIFALGRR